jgi:hypothetical protein
VAIIRGEREGGWRVMARRGSMRWEAWWWVKVRVGWRGWRERARVVIQHYEAV